MLLTIAGWLLWGLIALFSVGLLFSGNRDGGVRFMSRTQGLLLALGLVATVAFPISKFHLLWIFPVAFVTPMVIMQVRVANGMRHASSTTSQERVHEDAAQSESLESLQEKLAKAKRNLELLETPETIFAFGQICYDGDEVPQNYSEAAGWWKIAAEQGHTKAAHNLGLMYEEGKGVSQDFTEAANWYELAVRKGNPSSQNNLAALLETGQGINQDVVRAATLYNQAALNGDANGLPNLKRLTSDLEHAALNGDKEALIAFERVAAALRKETVE
jgi:hypothetical protein